ncbi:hypothetical protein JGU66_33020 [Myxococcaceae bacterium JPH2]|nr:hypothetical protein [Myxococcaceae bacterium JPH2]
MTSPWQRRRQPDDVPTPVAVAVSDYCRRAKAPASAADVREALALLANEDDFRVRALTDVDPETTPLGPFAVVDILGGTAVGVAAQRQSCGYYDVVQELARVREEKTPPPAPAPQAPTFAIPAPRPVPAGDPDEAARKPDVSVADRIAPRKRTAPEPEALPAIEDEPGESAFPKKDLPRPRGRFTRVEAPRIAFLELTRMEGKALLEEAIAAAEHRFSLLKTLSHRFNGSRGELTQVDMENVLRDHGLMAILEAKEKGNLIEAYSTHRGASGRVAWALGLSPHELQRLTAALLLTEEVEMVRERFRREALSTSSHLTQRLDLLGRDKYLVDLGIKKRFTDTLRKELERLVRDQLPDAEDLHSLAEAVGRKHGAPGELVTRAFERLGMSESLRKQLMPGTPHSSP